MPQRKHALHPQSDTLVMTSSPPSWAPLAEITCRSQQAWAEKHGYDYYADVSDLRDRELKSGNMIGIAGFVKFDLFMHFLPKYKRVIWLDADLVVTNYEMTWENIMWDLPEGQFGERKYDVTLPFDFNGINATVIGMHSTPRTIDFAWAVNNTGRKFFLGHDWKEMESMRYFGMTPPYLDLLGYMSVQRLCALHPGAYLPYVPEAVTKKYEWDETSFSIHLSALPLDRRIELAQEYAAKCALD
jgi:hypothetical protein